MLVKNRVNSLITKFLSLSLSILLALPITGCSKETSGVNTSVIDPNPVVITEQIQIEKIENEAIFAECILSESCVEELALAENTISELLLQEETINEVLLCQTIYVAQASIEEFSEHSQISRLFGNEVDLSSVLNKIALGTGVIVTLVVLTKAGLPDPIASIVVAAANESLDYAIKGAVIGSLFGGLTGAGNEIDQSGRSSAVISFAVATVGLILTVGSLVAAIPTAGSTTITAAAGIKLVIAGITMIGATVGTVFSGYNAVKTFQSTDVESIDWDNIDWEAVGVSSVQKAIHNGSDGYMWGSIIGAIKGGADGFDYYQKYNAPYTKYSERIKQTPKNGNGGHWNGERGNSDYILDKPIVLADGTEISSVTYRNGIPDFSPYQIAQVKIPRMTNKRYGNDGNFMQASKALAEYWSRIYHNGKTWTVEEVELFRTSNHLTWHEMSNMESMQLVPFEVNQQFTHFGGVAEYNAMIGQQGVSDFD